MHTIRSLANPFVIRLDIVDIFSTSEALRAVSQLGALAAASNRAPMLIDCRELVIGPADSALVAAAVTGACRPGDRIAIVAHRGQRRRIERLLFQAAALHLVTFLEGEADLDAWLQDLTAGFPRLSETERRHLRELARLESKPQHSSRARPPRVSVA